MEQCNDTTDTEAQILKTDSDVDQHTYDCHRYRNNGIGLHFVADGGTDGLGGNQVLVHTEIIRKHIVHRVPLLHCQGTCLENHFIGILNGLNLYRTGNPFHKRNHLGICLLQGHCLVKGHAGLRAALELQTVIQCVTRRCLIDTHHHKARNYQSGGNSEEQSLLG